MVVDGTDGRGMEEREREMRQVTADVWQVCDRWWHGIAGVCREIVQIGGRVRQWWQGR